MRRSELCGMLQNAAGFSLRRLDFMELGIHAAGLDQFIVGAALHNPALAHDKDEIGVTNRRQTMSDYECGSTLH